MQLICEAYQLLKDGLGLTRRRAARGLRRVEQGRARQLPDRDHPRHPRLEGRRRRAAGRQDPRHRRPEGHRQVDRASRALDLGMPVTLIGEAVFARCLSALKDERVARVARCSPARSRQFNGDTQAVHRRRSRARSTPRRSSRYAQGYMLLRAAAKEYRWKLNYGGIALMWRGGCIIRSRFLGKIKEAFDKNPKLDEPAARRLLPRAMIKSARTAGAARRARRVENGIPMPAFSHRPGVLRRLPHARACRRTCSRPSATTSARTPTSASTSRAASSSTPTGPAAAAHVSSSTYNA